MTPIIALFAIAANYGIDHHEVKFPSVALNVVENKAQPQDNIVSEDPMDVQKSMGPIPTVPSPSGQLDKFLTGLGLEISVNNDIPKGEISFAQKLHPTQTLDPINQYKSSFSQTSISSSISAPLSGTDDLTDPQVLNKLSNGPVLAFAVSHYGNSAQTTEDGLSVITSGGWQYGAEVSLGYKSYNFTSAGSLTGNKVTRVPFSFGGFIAYYPPDEQTMWGISIESQHAYKASDTEVICKSVVVVPSEDCVNDSPSAPDRDSGIIATVEHRRAFGLNWSFADIAMAPKLAVNALDGEVGLELPVYLLISGDSPVLPGVKIGYSSGEDNVVFGVFLKAGFGLTR